MKTIDNICQVPDKFSEMHTSVYIHNCHRLYFPSFLRALFTSLSIMSFKTIGHVNKTLRETTKKLSSCVVSMLLQNAAFFVETICDLIVVMYRRFYDPADQHNVTQHRNMQLL